MANRIMIITADDNDAKLLQDALNKARDGPFETERLAQLSAALSRLSKDNNIDAILVDLALPDSQGLATFDQLFAAVPRIPILTLTTEDKEALSIEAVQRGAQGYLCKGHFSSYLVPQSLRNIIMRKAVEESAFIDKARAEITLNSISDAVIGTDMDGKVDYLNIAAENLTGWDRNEARGQPIEVVMQLLNQSTRQSQPSPVELVLQQNEPMGLTTGTILIRRDGSEAMIEDSSAPIHDSSGQLKGAVMVFHDITAAQMMAAKMAHLAQHDFLTNLPNRLLLMDRIAQAIVLAERYDTQISVLFLDLDNFKHINDSLGHETGDTILQSVAQRLCECVRSTDTVSRQGGDEFVILVTEDHFAENAALIADKIIAALTMPHRIAGYELYVTTSIGISTYPVDARNSETLLKNADTAMYQAKAKGRNNYQFFQKEMNILAVERQLIETHLRQAIGRQEFVLHYQPKVNLDTGKITGAEALLRWQHPEWGQILPGRFVPVAEECGLIVPIGQWVLREACEQARQWIAAGLNCCPVAVNISALEFRDKEFVKRLRTILAEARIEPNNLELEITESVLMRDAQSSIMILHQLKNLGIQLAVDDFGTGYSSLSYLNQFPIDTLKIDQSFVLGINSTNDNNNILISAIINIGASLKQRVIAEGVENPIQLSFLKTLHCEEGQGYLFSQPLIAEQFATLLSTGICATG